MIQKLFTGSNPKNKHVPSLWFKLYARQPLVFESGFTGFPGLTITPPVWRGRLLLNGAFISKLLADALRIGEKDDKK